MAEPTITQRVSDFFRGGSRNREPEPPNVAPAYAPVSHDDSFFVERDVDGTLSFAGPFDSYREAKTALQDLQRGETRWTDLETRSELPPIERWPRRVAGHRLDTPRLDGGFRVLVERSPEKQTREGEIQYEPGFRAVSSDLYRTEAQARDAAREVARSLEAGGGLDESRFEVETIERAPERVRMPNAPITAGEYRRDRDLEERDPAQRPFRVRDAMPDRNEPYFFVDEGNRVVFDGPNSRTTTPPRPRDARQLAARLNADMRNGLPIDFNGHGFGKPMPSHRRVYVVAIDDKHHVYFNANMKLARSGPMTADEAGRMRDALAQKLTSGEKIDWNAFGLQWQNRHPDRLKVQEMPGGQFKLVYEFKENVALSETSFPDAGEANRALDAARRQIFDFQRIDMRGWDYYPKAESLEMRIRQGEDHKFRIFTGAGRAYFQAFDDHAEAQHALGEFERQVADTDFVPGPPQWLWPDQLSQVPLSRRAEEALDRMADAIQNDRPDLYEVIDSATRDLSDSLAVQLEDLGPADLERLRGTLEQFAEVRDLHEQRRHIGKTLDRPDLKDPRRDSGKHEIRRDYQRQQKEVRQKLSHLPPEQDLARNIAVQLKGKRFDPAILAAQVSKPELRGHVETLLTNYQTVQQQHLPRALALGLASQRMGQKIPAHLLGENTHRWLGSVANLAPVQHVGVIAAVRQAVRTTQQAFATERAAGVG